MTRLTALLVASLIMIAAPAIAQDLVPGAYTPGPIRLNVVTFASSFSKGDITFDPALPIDNAHATLGGGVIGFGRSFSFAGRYANIGFGLPFAGGHLEGLVQGVFQERSLAGLSDMSARIAVNLYGARAMTLPEFKTYRSSTVVGLGLSVGIPVGQYDPSRVINIGSNRWSFKPELGISRRRGAWTFEGDVGMVLFTNNTNFVNGGVREQKPILTLQGHLIRTFRPGLWIALDGNYWHGGLVTTNGIRGTEEQNNSRLGGTLAIPVKRQQLRVAFSLGAYTNLGGDFSSIGVSYSYAWLKK